METTKLIERKSFKGAIYYQWYNYETDKVIPVYPKPGVTPENVEFIKEEIRVDVHNIDYRLLTVPLDNIRVITSPTDGKPYKGFLIK